MHGLAAFSPSLSVLLTKPLPFHELCSQNASSAESIYALIHRLHNIEEMLTQTMRPRYVFKFSELVNGQGKIFCAKIFLFKFKDFASVDHAEFLNLNISIFRFSEFRFILSQTFSV